MCTGNAEPHLFGFISCKGNNVIDGLGVAATLHISHSSTSSRPTSSPVNAPNDDKVVQQYFKIAACMIVSLWSDYTPVRTEEGSLDDKVTSSASEKRSFCPWDFVQIHLYSLLGAGVYLVSIESHVDGRESYVFGE